MGLPWQSLGGFVRISTHPRVAATPLDAAEAWSHVRAWLDADPAWIPPATMRTAAICAELSEQLGITGNLVPDAQLAALALEHGLTVLSADTDFARFRDVDWVNPLP
ncbi:MAG TPA: TA system VapC family ribonuclease toxin [Acidimicrobiia bacterium]|nr:TA system VapC family ribonuclease toxin [Acidimicrobiia bacterium]